MGMVDTDRSNFRGHTKRQHRASSAKGGQRRTQTIPRIVRMSWSRKGGEANRRRLLGADKEDE